jgi:hypothetical protein
MPLWVAGTGGIKKSPYRLSHTISLAAFSRLNKGTIQCFSPFLKRNSIQANYRQTLHFLRLIYSLRHPVLLEAMAISFGIFLIAAGTLHLSIQKLAGFFMIKLRYHPVK